MSSGGDDSNSEDDDARCTDEDDDSEACDEYGERRDDEQGAFEEECQEHPLDLDTATAAGAATQHQADDDECLEADMSALLSRHLQEIHGEVDAVKAMMDKNKQRLSKAGNIEKEKKALQTVAHQAARLLRVLVYPPDNKCPADFLQKVDRLAKELTSLEGGGGNSAAHSKRDDIRTGLISLLNRIEGAVSTANANPTAGSGEVREKALRRPTRAKRVLRTQPGKGKRHQGSPGAMGTGTGSRGKPAN